MKTPARATVDRLVALQAVTAELASALEVPRIAEIVVDHGMRAVGAATAALWIVDDAELRLVRSLGMRAEVHARNLVLPLTLDAPLCAAVNTGVAILVGSPEEYATKFPASLKRMAAYGSTLKGALGCIPLVQEGKSLGAMIFEWSDSRTFEGDDSTYLDLLASHAVQALERGRLFTALRAAEEEALRAKKTAEDAAAAREVLLAMVAHDLRNPLGVVQLKVQVMQLRLPESEAGDKIKQDLEAIQRHTVMMGRLIEDLLDVASIDARRMSLVRASHSPAEIVDTAAELVRRLAEQKRIALELRATQAGAPIDCDRQRLLQVLANLLGNAIKFSPVGSTVVLEALQRQEGTTFAVSDEGEGIPPSDREAVFEQWTRGARTIPAGEERAGAGLGLYIARGLVLAHSGKIWIESAREADGVASGTRVSFHLP